MLFEIGKPHGHDLIAASVTITPKPIRVTPSVGNYYGQIIAIRAPGMTKADESNVSMVRSQRTWGECTKFTVPEYGWLLCEQIIGRGFSDHLQYTDSLFIRTISDGVNHGCSDMDHDDLDPTDTNCGYTSLSTGNFPNVTSGAVSDSNTIVLTGSGFEFNSDTSASVTFAGVDADSVSVDSDT